MNSHRAEKGHQQQQLQPTKIAILWSFCLILLIIEGNGDIPCDLLLKDGHNDMLSTHDKVKMKARIGENQG